jgi:LytR cell envelope-related transcriptional attenuator/cell envelope-related transcriptional attenuator-like protein
VGDAAGTVPVRNGPVNVLVLSAGPKKGASADSAVLLHLSASRDNVTALAIPPDLVTDIPACQVGGKTVPGAKAQPFAAALTERGPGCSLRTAEQLTGLQVDHVVEIDYAAVPSGTKGVAAADRCVDRVLAAPRNLTALANAEPAALTADTAIGTPETLSNLAAAMGAVDPKNTTFVTVPVKSGGSAAVDTGKATQLYKMMAADVSLSAAQKPAPDPKLTGSRATAHNTRVEIYNGTGRFGASQDVLAWLQNTEHADRTTNGGDAHAKATRTTLEYAPNQADQARSLAAMMGLPASALIEGKKDAAPRANMKLTLGADFTEPGVPVGPPSSPPAGVKLTPGTAVRCS